MRSYRSLVFGSGAPFDVTQSSSGAVGTSHWRQHATSRGCMSQCLQGTMGSWLTMNSLVRKALLGTKRRRGPFFTMVYLHSEASTWLSRSCQLHLAWRTLTHKAAAAHP